jgi:hypothetical protein
VALQVCPPSIEQKLLDHFTWIRDNLSLLSDNSISDTDWLKRREVGGAAKQPGCIWISKGGHPSSKKAKQENPLPSAITASGFVSGRRKEQGNVSSREDSSNSSSASKASSISSSVMP